MLEMKSERTLTGVFGAKESDKTVISMIKGQF